MSDALRPMRTLNTFKNVLGQLKRYQQDTMRDPAQLASIIEELESGIAMYSQSNVMQTVGSINKQFEMEMEYRKTTGGWAIPKDKAHALLNAGYSLRCKGWGGDPSGWAEVYAYDFGEWTDEQMQDYEEDRNNENWPQVTQEHTAGYAFQLWINDDGSLGA
jgi:hypothetical protein